MKRILFLFVLLLTLHSGVYAQRSAAIVDFGYRNRFETTNWGMGLQYKYSLPSNLKLVTDVMAYFPQDSDFGLDVGLNLQYYLNACQNLYIYPFVGGIMSNHSFSAEPDARNQTEFGVNLGLGFQYNVSAKGFFNLDFRYNLIDKEEPAWYTNYGLFRFGYGFRF